MTRLIKLIFRLIRPVYREVKYNWANFLSRYRCEKYRLSGCQIGDSVTLGPGVNLAGKVKIGSHTTLVSNILVQGDVEIGSNVIIAAHSTLLSTNHDYNLCNALPYGTDYIMRKIVVEDNVWIGTHVRIGPGAVIGQGAIIGMGSVVTGEVPQCAIAAGNPARVIKFRDADRYQRLIREGKYLNNIRCKIPNRFENKRVNSRYFREKISERGFVLNIEMKTGESIWQSAILYKLAMENKVLFGNAGEYHLAIVPDLLQDLELARQNIIQAMQAVKPLRGNDGEILQTDLAELAETHKNPIRINQHYLSVGGS